MRPKEGHHRGHKDNWEQRCCYTESFFDMLCARSILDNALRTHANGLLRRPTTIKKICTICKRCMTAFIHMAFISKLGFWRFFKKAEIMHVLGMLHSKSPCRVWNLFNTKTFNYLVRSLIGMYWKEEAYLSSTKNAFQSSFSNIFWSTFLVNLNRLMQISSVCKFEEFPAG